MKSVLVLIVTLASTLASNAFAADQCFYFSGTQESEGIHRVSVSGDILTVKQMGQVGASVVEIRGFGCDYRVADVSDATSIKYQVKQTLRASCVSVLPIVDSSFIVIEKQKDELISELLGFSAYYAQIADVGTIPFSAHPCAEVDAR